MRCAVVGCNSDNQSKRNPCKDVKFFSFPKDANLSKKWLHLTKRGDKVNVKNAAICSKHFGESDYKVNLKHILLGYTPKNNRGLKDDAVPTQNLPESNCVSLFGPSTSGAEEKPREKRKIVFEKRQQAQPINAYLLDRGEDITEPRPEKELINNREGQNVDCNMVVELSTTSEISVQTIENMNIDQRLLDVTRENEKLKYQLAGVKKVFSENQIKKMYSQKRIRWSVSEISSAISMYAAGPRAYRLSLKKGFPYPAVSTLKKWRRKNYTEEKLC